MKQFVIILLSLCVGFAVGRLTQTPTSVPTPLTSGTDYNTGDTKEEIQEAAEPPGAEKSPKTKRRHRRHEAGGTFKIDDLSIRIGQPLIRKTNGGEECFTLPFEFENLSEGRIYSPKLIEFEMLDNFGNESGSFYPASRGMFSDDEFVGEKLEDKCDELKPGESGVRYYDFKFTIESATTFELNAVWEIADNTSYWDTERHRITYLRDSFGDGKPNETQ